MKSAFSVYQWVNEQNTVTNSMSQWAEHCHELNESMSRTLGPRTLYRHSDDALSQCLYIWTGVDITLTSQQVCTSQWHCASRKHCDKHSAYDKRLWDVTHWVRDIEAQRLWQETLGCDKHSHTLLWDTGTMKRDYEDVSRTQWVVFIFQCHELNETLGQWRETMKTCAVTRDWLYSLWRRVQWQVPCHCTRLHSSTSRTQWVVFIVQCHELNESIKCATVHGLWDNEERLWRRVQWLHVTMNTCP